jgi:MFS family permease
LATPTTDAHSADRLRSRLFLASCIALIATAMTFAIRGDIMGAWNTQFHLTKEQVGWIAGAGFGGFTLSIFIGGPLCDLLGLGVIMLLAFLGHLTGIVLTLIAPGFGVLFTGTLVMGIGNGLVEAAINPLVATVYPDRKTARLNALHAWFPGGIVIGVLVAFALTQINAAWQIKMATILLPVVVYGLLFLGVKFPKTERVQSGVSAGAMFKEALQPLFLVFLFCMLLTACTELGPNQWITDILKNVLPGGMVPYAVLVLGWISLVMCIGRFFAGPIAHKLSPTGLLIGSSFFSILGLLALSAVNGFWTAMAAATVFAVGVCYFWPTMLGVTSERFPKGGAFLLGLMGGAGNLAVMLVLPAMGRIMDIAAGTGATLKTGGPLALRYVAVLPVILTVIFLLVYLRDRTRGGYQVVKLTKEEAPVQVTADS